MELLHRTETHGIVCVEEGHMKLLHVAEKRGIAAWDTDIRKFCMEKNTTFCCSMGERETRGIAAWNERHTLKRDTWSCSMGQSHEFPVWDSDTWNCCREVR